jgi:hypothetical protein
MSGRTGGSADAPAATESSGPGVVAAITDQVREMSAEDFRKSLVLSGIVAKDGKLTAKYRR